MLFYGFVSLFQSVFRGCENIQQCWYKGGFSVQRAGMHLSSCLCGCDPFSDSQSMYDMCGLPSCPGIHCGQNGTCSSQDLWLLWTRCASEECSSCWSNYNKKSCTEKIIKKNNLWVWNECIYFWLPSVWGHQVLQRQWEQPTCTWTVWWTHLQRSGEFNQSVDRWALSAVLSSRWLTLHF